ncbi:Outer-membrane lipoprotein carrier protein precursor [Roseivivax sp. THAF40]|uniref:LolA family protein n=1 Tax=unclassified Roseivivax TaxID=2639302 RepID=UPI0012698436|nr:MULTISPECIES: outer membrane lipoprotein carrier protein LolA [unclassified Roseivivax]QFS84477.1 Outer-membrane lipoprotein carrier protein precursor [Roseivivax sp. THAF197b]QFT48305.1 Outer-membrane lipoprotein carrier protein precursor [Roseivivax sp. THAF40]
MRITGFIAALTFGLSLAAPASAEKLGLGQISNYLNSIRTAQSDFTQVNADGTISTGEVSLSRPGKMRFDYNPPEQALVMAGRGTVVIIDRRVGSTETYPLGQTPLSIILAPNVDLSEPGVVVGHTYDGTATTVTARDPRRPEYGTIEMKFTDAPAELRQWIITDQNGQKTTVILGALQKKSLPNSLFNIDRAIAAAN